MRRREVQRKAYLTPRFASLGYCPCTVAPSFLWSRLACNSFQAPVIGRKVTFCFSAHVLTQQILAVFFRQYCRSDRGLQGEAVALLLTPPRYFSIWGRLCFPCEVGADILCFKVGNCPVCCCCCCCCCRSSGPASTYKLSCTRLIFLNIQLNALQPPRAFHVYRANETVFNSARPVCASVILRTPIVGHIVRLIGAVAASREAMDGALRQGHSLSLVRNAWNIVIGMAGHETQCWWRMYNMFVCGSTVAPHDVRTPTRRCGLLSQ